MRTRTHAVIAALPLALMAALTGCGSDDGDGVASANGDSATTSEDERHNQLLEYAQCLRDHGLDVEDPAPGEGVRIENEGGPAQSDEALKACEDLAPPPPAGAPDEGDEREEMLAYAQCMRDHGVEAFADPKPGQGINIGPEVVEDPDFAQAEETCNEMFGGGGDRNVNGGGA